MNSLKTLFRKLGLLLKRDRFRSELQEEMAFHRSATEEELKAKGMSAEMARRAAKKQFGNETRLREQSHEAIGFRMESVWQDMRYAVRQMRQSPGFTLAVVITLALGIGANTAIFSVVEATLLRPLPYPDGERLITISDARTAGESTGGLVGIPRFFDLRDRTHSFESIAFYCFENPTVVIDGRLPEQVDGSCVTGQFWRVLGVQPILGRAFDESSDRPGANPVIVISFSAWQRMFGGDDSVIGKTITVDKKSATVIGVMPRNFVSPGKADVWRPAGFDVTSWHEYRGDGTRFANVIGRLKPGITKSMAANELQAIGGQLAREHPETDAPWRFASLTLRDNLYGKARPALILLMVASSVLLLIACVNVASLLFARATARQREVAVRRALGASQARIAGQLLTESFLLAVVGGAVGLVTAFVLTRVADSRLHQALQLQGMISLNLPVVGFALVVSIVAGLLFGIAPVLASSHRDLQRHLKIGEVKVSVGGTRTRSVFVAIQVGLSLMLLAGACLLTKSLWKLTQSPMGFNPENVLAFDVNLPWDGYHETADAFYMEVEHRIEAIPGVAAVGQISALPTEAWHVRTSYDVDWKPSSAHHDAVSAEVRVIAGDYAKVMEIPILAGRNVRFKEPNAVLVNVEFARRYMGGADSRDRVIGHHIKGTDGDSLVIVGVLGDVRGTAGSLAGAIEPEIYYAANSLTKRTFVVRSNVPESLLVEAIREQVHKLDPQQAVGEPRMLKSMLSVSVAQPVLNMSLMAGFAMIALALACVGIYGVVAYSVAQRRQEIGVRMALGASRGQISGLFLKQTLTSASVGMVCGGVATLLLTRLLRSQLYGVEPNDPTTFLIAILLLLVPVFAASLRPALKAASLDPVEALRTE